ncbi:MAG TPA: hypothetical protein VGM91_00650 [Conexibacter sp.]|jgi:hypothetical protein
MSGRKRALGIGAAIAAATTIGVSASAEAAFPNFSGCNQSITDFGGCLNIQSRSGSLDIKGFTVPLGDSIEVRGSVTQPDAGFRFTAARGTSGFIARPIQVPGGILGIDFPIPGNAVTATAVLAGSPSDIRVDLPTISLSLPIKLELQNPLIGPLCRIGTDSNPVHLNLITGTTNPAPPNRPITGAIGTSNISATGITITGNVNVDNGFAIPGASNCGLGIGLINTLIDAKLKLPSAGGNNTMISTNDVALGVPAP